MMAENGLDLRTWLTVVGVFVMFFGFPAATIAFDLRKKRRAQAAPAKAGDPATQASLQTEQRREQVHDAPTFR